MMVTVDAMRYAGRLERCIALQSLANFSIREARKIVAIDAIKGQPFFSRQSPRQVAMECSKKSGVCDRGCKTECWWRASDEHSLVSCADCGAEIGNDAGPPDGWQLEDGRTICHACCVEDTGSIIDEMRGNH